MCFEEFLHGVSVPFGNAESLDNVSALVEQLNLWVEPTEVFDLKILELGWSLGLNERLDLGIRPELACAHLEDSFWILSRNRSS